MVTQKEYELFLNLHQPQLIASGVPQHFWETLHRKITTQCFDSGETFALTILELDSSDSKKQLQLQIKAEDGITHTDPKHVYLVDHAWTFSVDFARKQLLSIDNLRDRMAAIMGVNGVDKQDVTDSVFKEMWRYANSYSIGSAANVEDRLPVWYIMDEVGCGMRHSDEPNFRMVPFLYVPEGVGYSLIFPVKDLGFADVVTRDYAEGCTSEDRKAVLLPWLPNDFTKLSYAHANFTPDYYLSGHIKETLPILTNLRKNAQRSTYKVYTQYEYVKNYLTDANFEIVENETDADILWYTKHFKDFEALSLNNPDKYVNQFPFEYVLTIKDLLCITCRRSKTTKWLPTSYNLKVELNEFVSYHQNRTKNALDNHWIIKPFNLARGLDIHITDNLNYIMRLATTGPKIAQKYIETPVLFTRPEVGAVKFDIRYVVLLKSTKPLVAYAYKNFFLRFANKPFELDDFDDYEKHFTVMNYNKSAQLKHILCSEFLEKWEYPDHPWSKIEGEIFKMLREIFAAATSEFPPCGISESPQSRAVYAADIMLEWRNGEIQPKILEINWTPDCQRACEYYNDFYNNIFNLLFRDIENDEVFATL